jgi:hypothetical protein
MSRPTWEVADVIRDHGEAFLNKYGSMLTSTQRRALCDLAECRTAALGGHVERCLDCGHERIAYNSCRNRHCPKCQAATRARWFEQESAYLLPVAYHHVVFTLPATIAALALTNPGPLYNLLFEAAAATVRAVAADPRYLGALPGMLAVLHTWGQNLHHHPHLHCVVTGGGLSCNRRGEVDATPRWRSCRPNFFLPVRVLSRVYRDKFLTGLRRLAAAGKLRLPAALAEPDAFARWVQAHGDQDWVVYAKPPFAGAEQVLKYLARYTHRVAISNHRIQSIAAGQVSFTWKDYAHGGVERTLTLSAEEFLRRFVQHVLPRGFVKVRHYGLLANRRRGAKLAVARRLLFVAAVATSLMPALPVCPTCAACGSQRVSRLKLPEVGVALHDACVDSS